MTSGQVWVAIFAAICGSGVLGAVVAGLFSKRRMGADAAKIITEAASGVVLSMEADLARQRLVMSEHQARHEEQLRNDRDRHRSEMRKLIESHAEEMDEVRRVLQLHVAWDLIAIAKMQDLNVELPPAPPLLPARRFTHPEPGSTLGE